MASDAGLSSVFVEYTVETGTSVMSSESRCVVVTVTYMVVSPDAGVLVGFLGLDELGPVGTGLIGPREDGGPVRPDVGAEDGAFDEAGFAGAEEDAALDEDGCAGFDEVTTDAEGADGCSAAIGEGSAAPKLFT